MAVDLPGIKTRDKEARQEGPALNPFLATLHNFALLFPTVPGPQDIHAVIVLIFFFAFGYAALFLPGLACVVLNRGGRV